MDAIRNDLKDVTYPIIWGLATTIQRSFEEGESIIIEGHPLLLLLQAMGYVDIVAQNPIMKTFYHLNDRARESYERLVEEGFFDCNFNMDVDSLDVLDLCDKDRSRTLDRVVGLKRVVVFQEDDFLYIGNLDYDYSLSGVILEKDEDGSHCISGERYRIRTECSIKFDDLDLENAMAYNGSDQDRMRHRVFQLFEQDGVL